MPILLSVGYSACHWCHVMERESFEDPHIAKLMNDNFVCIKVDREERPDIDSIYMMAVQAMTGHGGWPMTVFLTPEGKPFYGGTYFPPEDRRGMPGFPKVVEAIARAYRENRGDVVRTTAQLIQRMEQVTLPIRSLEPLTTEVLGQAYRAIASQFDDRHGGVGLQPKFPQPMTYDFLLRYYQRVQDPDALDMVELTLDRMANGGIYDQIGGGFHRYSTDTYWLVPHFEKMLYDNALLVKLYLHAYQVTGKDLYRRVVEETLDYVRREMTDPAGGFYSAQDADSEGVEGKFLRMASGRRSWMSSAKRTAGSSTYTTASHGKATSRDAPSCTSATASGDSASMTTSSGSWWSGRSPGFLEARSRRVAPGLDDKILTSWNGMMLRGFAEAAAVLGRAGLCSNG